MTATWTSTGPRRAAEEAESDAPRSRPRAIVLAAGTGSRLGLGPKALLPWGAEGEPLAIRAARAAADAGCEPLVAVGPRGDEVEALLAASVPSAAVVRVADAGTGMSASLRAAVARVSSTPGAGERTPVVVLLVDQPGVDGAVVARLLDAHADGRARATRARWDGAPGHPIVFDLGALREAATLAAGDAGAREWLARRRDLVQGVECADLARGDDVDTRADLASWVRARARARSGAHRP